MKKSFGCLTTVLLLSACLPISLPGGEAPPPQVDSLATINAIVQTAAVETLAAQPSPTTAPPSDTLSAPTQTPDNPPTGTFITPAENLTTTPATATAGTPLGTTPSTAVSRTLTPTLGVLKYGTLPPAVPSSQITLVNRSQVQVYVSLQNYPKNGTAAILEYPVKNTVNVNAPLGYYVYVAWVGGRQFTGHFSLKSNEEILITIYKDKIFVK